LDRLEHVIEESFVFALREPSYQKYTKKRNQKFRRPYESEADGDVAEATSA